MLDIGGSQVTVAVCYIVSHYSKRSREYATRFARTLVEFDPVYDFQLNILFDGTLLEPWLPSLFPDANFHMVPHTQGWDIASYQNFATRTQADFMICLGESCCFNKAGWLSRIIEAREESGPGMYGFFSSNITRRHLNTTAFAVDARFLRLYPLVNSRKGRYDFEHGQFSLWQTVEQSGGAARLVTWDGIYQPSDWRKPDNILWKGDQSNGLMRCRHTDEFDQADAITKFTWQDNADRGYPEKCLTSAT
jgi:hypothetical protein